MKYIGQALAFSALCGSAVYLEVNGLWIVVVLWVICGTWQDSKKE